MESDLIPFSAVTATAHSLAEADGFGIPLPEHYEAAHSLLMDRSLDEMQSYYDAEREDESDDQADQV